MREGSVTSTGLTASHPLVKFAKDTENIDCAIALDDTVVWGALSLMADASDLRIAALAKRLRDRKLYKCIDVRTRIAHEKGDAAASSAEADRVCADIRDDISAWSDSQTDSVPRALIDQQSRSPYKRITETKGPLDQINIRTDGGHLVDLAQRSKVVAELQAYKLLRIYHDGDDAEARNKINEIIDARIKKWPQ